MYVKTPGFYTYFSINYINIFKKICNYREYSDNEYIYFSNIIGGIINDLNSGIDHNANMIRTYLRQTPKYCDKKHDEILFFMNMLCYFYDIRPDQETIDKTKILCKNKIREYGNFLDKTFQSNNKFRYMIGNVLVCGDETINETLISTYYRHSPAHDDIIKKYKLYIFYNNFLADFR